MRPPFTGGPIVPPFQIGRSFGHERFFDHRHHAGSFFWSGSVGRSQTVIILQQFAVPAALPQPSAPPVKPQIVEIQPSPETDAVVIFSPSMTGE